MTKFTNSLIAVSGLMACSFLTASASITDFDLTKFRYQIDSHSVFHNSKANQIQNINRDIASHERHYKAKSFENPAPALTLPASNVTGNIDAPNGELWYYTGELDYIEIPPHDDIAFTDRILQEYKFDIYDSEMKLLGSIKSKVNYKIDEVRAPQCEITPVATRNFFNTDDDVEIIVALAVNRELGGNNYYSLVYSLNGEKDSAGYDKPITVINQLVGDVIEGPVSKDGSDNFYISFMNDVWEDVDDDASFWDYLLSQKVEIEVFGKALDNKGPRSLFSTVMPLIQLPGDQESVSPLISMLNNGEVIYSISYYKEPFYNRYDDPMSEEMTMREGNSLVIDLYKATESKFEKYSSTEIPMALDPMADADGNPTCLFSYYGVGELRYRGDFLFDAPGTEAGKPDFIITRGNYQVSTDGITNSYFTYGNDGKLKNTLFLYADGTLQMGEIKGCEPQQLFVSADSYGYMYNFIDIYSAKKATEIPADFYYDDDSDPELLTANVARTPKGETYEYIFELRYPIVDEDDNDILRFMHIDKEGKYLSTDYVNMGYGVAYAQSYLSTEAVAPHAYSSSDTPAYMFLVKRGVEGSDAKIEELMIAEAESEENPSGKTLLQVGPEGNEVLASIVPEFGEGDIPGRLFIYYYDSADMTYTLDVYNLPLDKNNAGINGIDNSVTLSNDGHSIVTAGEIRVFTLDGKLITSGKDSVEIASLNSGIYIIKAAGKTFKMMK